MMRIFGIDFRLDRRKSPSRRKNSKSYFIQLSQPSLKGIEALVRKILEVPELWPDFEKLYRGMFELMDGILSREDEIDFILIRAWEGNFDINLGGDIQLDTNLNPDEKILTNALKMVGAEVDGNQVKEVLDSLNRVITGLMENGYAHGLLEFEMFSTWADASHIKPRLFAHDRDEFLF